ncbi:12236_t:CDS:2 [Acaulospora colombiana]|uniref:12236_t:CDS:1 n=1 Tax=Acaulospora colombiana TaxID=27376 RepID=A0ACA9KBH2_9GLOM|nr:12236_t:CDS:2 [Acaulospora colombiana]
MDEGYMWKLSSGRIVEKELLKLGNDLVFEHAIHSFILDVEDELIMEHFTEKELEEIEGTTIPVVPDISDEIDNFLSKFLGKTNLNEIRQIIKESKFGESTSVPMATRKNKKVKRKPGERRKIGRRGDWTLRAVGNGNKDEFGAGERINWDKDARKNIQTIGIIHEGLMMSLVYADNPKGYVCRFRRSNHMEVPDTAEKFDSILSILASVLIAKGTESDLERKITIRCLHAYQLR